MSPQKTNFIGLINHKLLKLTMSVPVGKEMYTVVDEGTEHGTGVSRDYVTIDWEGAHHTHYFQGPTLIGLGPKVAKLERQRLLLLRAQVEQAITEVDGFLEFFEENNDQK